MKYDIKEREAFNEKYDGVSSNTMDKLVGIYNLASDVEMERKIDILKCATCGILTLLSTILPIYMLNNVDTLKQNIFNFVMFGVLTPVLLGLATVKNIYNYKLDNESSILIQKYFDKMRKDIPESLIEEEAERRQSEKEYNEIYKYSKDPKLVRKLNNVILGQDFGKNR